MSTSVGTMRAGTNKLSGPKDKSAKGDKSMSQATSIKTESHSKMQPTQEQLRLAQMMSTNQSDADPNQVKQLMDLTGKSEDVVVIALHDAGNDADRAVMMLLEGGEEQGEWHEQSGKKKKKNTQKENANHEEQSDARSKDKNVEKNDHQDMPPRRGRRNGGPPPRLARGRGRDRGNMGDREKVSFGDREKEREIVEDWDNDKEDKGQRNDRGDRGRLRGRGGFGGRKPTGPPSSGRGRFNNSNDRFGSSNDRENRGFNRPRRFEKMNNTQPMDGPEIDTWTNETAEKKVANKDTDWNSWNDSWVNDEDQWTGTLEETKVFTPSHVKMPEGDKVTNEPPSSLGQRLDVGSLFESAKFTKAPDYSKPSGDSYISQFNQAATESIKNTIGIGSASRPQIVMTPQNSSTSLGLSNLGQNTGQVQGNTVLSSLQQSSSQSSSMQHGMTQLSQISQPGSNPSLSQLGIGNPATQVSSSQAPQQSRIPSVVQQQLPPASMNSMQQRAKPQRSKLPPPSKIPSTAVEMPGHIPRNPQLDVQFGLDFGSEPPVQFGFGGSGDSTSVSSSYTATTNGPDMVASQLNQSHVTQSAGDGNTTIMPSPSAGSNKVPSGIESQGSSRSGVFHNSVYSSTSPQQSTDNPAHELDQVKVNETIPFLPSQLERKSSPMSGQRQGQNNQNLSSGSLTPSKSESTNAMASSYSSANGYAVPSYPSHPKGHPPMSQQSQNSSFPGQFPVNQSYPPTGQTQFQAPPNAAPFPTAQPSPYNSSNSSQNQFSSGPSQYSVGTSTLSHQTQYPSSGQNTYGSGPSQYAAYQNSNSFPPHPQSQSNFPSNQNGTTGATLYPSSTPSSVPSYSHSSQSNSYQSPSAGSYHAQREGSSNIVASTQSSSSMPFPAQPQASNNLKPASSQSSSNFNTQHYNNTPAPLQPSSLANKLGESLSKMTLKDTAVLDNHPSTQYEHPSSTSSVPTAVSLPSASSSASLSTGTNTISSISTVTSASSSSRVTSMPSTSGKAPPNLPPGVPLVGQYIMGQNTIPPFYSVQPPLYGYEDMQLLQQRMPMQTGSFYDVSAFPAPAGSTLPSGRDQQQPIPSVPFSGPSDTKLTRVDAQSPNASNQPQNAHSAQQPLFNFHYGYYYPSMFPGAAGLQYPTTVYPIPPVTNTAAHPGTTSTTQFQKSYPSHIYTTKGSGTNEITPNVYSKSHGQGFDKQAYHGGTPPPFNLPMASAAQTGPMGAPTTPYGGTFLPVMAAHQPHSQMMHHPMQQDSNTSSSRGMNPAGGQAKSGAAKAFGGPPYWNN